MRTRIGTASMGDQESPGRVASIISGPIATQKEWDENLRYDLARDHMVDTPPGVLPLMSAAVEFDAGQVQGALVIPVEAMAFGDRLRSCIARVPDGMAGRTIATRCTTRDPLQVTRCLSEGDPAVSRFALVDGPLMKIVRQDLLEGRVSG
jgi:hypothetical protein